MGILSFFKQILSPSPTSESASNKHEAHEYKAFRITPAPQQANGQYRVAAYIEKDIDGEVLQHHFIRSDMCSLESDCIELTLNKCQRFIDQLGDDIFKH